jgi:hypothetical protein
VTPSTRTAYEIDGGDPSTLPGDVLTYHAGGRPVQGDRTPPAGELRSLGSRPVTFSAIEDLSIAP